MNPFPTANAPGVMNDQIQFNMPAMLANQQNS